jgi:hypothetical protein
VLVDTHFDSGCFFWHPSEISDTTSDYEAFEMDVSHTNPFG